MGSLMRLKMDMIEAAYGLLCNVPSDGTSAAEGEEWTAAWHRWRDQYFVLLDTDSSKRRNKQTALFNRVLKDALKGASEGLTSMEPCVMPPEPLNTQWDENVTGTLVTDGLGRSVTILPDGDQPIEGWPSGPEGVSRLVEEQVRRSEVRRRPGVGKGH